MTSHLSYSIPSRPRKKAILHIPESHSLYVCPQSCARRQAIRALRNGEADRMSFLQLSQEDLISGDYETEVEQAVEQVLCAVSPRPRVIQLYVNCVDDFLGTDSVAMLEGLRGRFPGIRFTLSHINPISVDVEPDFARKMHGGLYELLEPPAAHDGGVSLLGSFAPLPRETELHAALAAVGAGPVRHIAECATFDEYQRLAAGCIALSVSNGGDASAREIADRCDMVSFSWHATYGLGEVDGHYRKLAGLLAAVNGEANETGVSTACAPSNDGGREAGGGSLERSASVGLGGEGGCLAAGLAGVESCASWGAMAPVLAAARERAHAAVARARAAVGNMPVAVGSDASFALFELAYNLAEYGFNVRLVLALHLKGSDVLAERKLLSAYPDMHVVRHESVEGIRGLDGGIEAGDRWLAIGADPGFLLGSNCMVDMFHDEGYFGYQGIERLMNEIIEAVDGSGAYAAVPENVQAAARQAKEGR